MSGTLPARREGGSTRPAAATAIIGARESHGEILDSSSGNVWQSIGPIARRDYEALPLEPGWLGLGIGTGAMDEHWFTRSPGAAADGPLQQREIGGHRFGLCARPLSAPTRSEGRTGPLHVSVEKHHVLRFAAGCAVAVLEHPDGRRFVHVIEGGAGKAPLPLPDGWRVEMLPLAGDWVVELPTPTTVFFFANGDSYQGPLASLPKRTKS